MESTGLTKTKILLVITIVILIVLSGFIAYQFLRPRTFFKGAYATYNGKTTVLLMTINITLRLEVVDLNSSHAKILTYIRINTPLGSGEYQNTTWVNFKNYTYNTENAKLIKSYENTIYVEGIGTRDCIIYEYKNKAGNEIIYYVDKETKWPIKIRYTLTPFNQEIGIDLNLVDTNVPGLKK